MALFGNERKILRQDLSETIPPTTGEGKLSYRVANLQGQGKRARQEDSFTFENALDSEKTGKNGMLAVVADGMGGMADGRKASQTAINVIRKCFPEINVDGNISQQLEDIVFAAGDKVLSLLDGKGGSTVVAAIIYDEKLYFTSVGDSFIYLLRNRELIRLNRSQTVLNREYMSIIRDGSIDPSGTFDLPEREALTQFLGMDGLEETDSIVKPFNLLPGDVLMLCSDGVAGVLTEECITECMSYGLPMDMCSAIEKAIKKADRKHQDNYTALLIQCKI